MNDPAIRNAILERARLLAKIADSEARTRRLKAQLSEINTFITQWEKFSGVPAPIPDGNELLSRAADSSQNGTDSYGANPPRMQNSKKEEVAAAARRILEAAPAPISRADLYQQLRSEGLRINGSNPEMVLSTMLWRAGRVEKITRLKSGGYWLETRDVPLNDSIDSAPSADDREDTQD
jgi:hypothetical protein